MFSKSCEYAIRAVVFLSSKDLPNKVVRIQDISNAIDAPVHYTSKILQQLSRIGMIRSLKGPTGGFYVDENNKKIMLIDIVTAIDGDRIFTGCGVGLKKCSDGDPCPLHEQFKSVRTSLKDLLENTSIEQLSEKFISGKALVTRESIQAFQENTD